jgi:hypothetical protein
MIRELWSSFPRLLEQNINGLLDTAGPNPMTAYRLYKACKADGLWSENFDTFSSRMTQFFSRPRAQRRKSHFDYYLNRPMPQDVYAGFYMNFRTAVVSEDSIHGLANWAHNLLRVGYKTTSAVISMDVLKQTLYRITNPLPHEKDDNIEFEDFSSVWQASVFKLFGNKYDHEIKPIVKELNRLNASLKEAERLQQLNPAPAIHIPKVEMDWVRDVHLAVVAREKVPDFPLEAGPEKQFLKDLVRTISLYKIAQGSSLSELINHREKIRLTIIKRCEFFLRNALDEAA